MNLIGELIEVISRRAGLDNVGDVGHSLKKRRRDGNSDSSTGGPSGDQVRSLLDVIGSDLLDFGQLIIAGMKMTTGEGEPEVGFVFRDGRPGFTKAGETLRSAVPDDRWVGAGSRAYADQNTRQQVRSEAMADADEAVFAVLLREAIQIKARRNTLDDQSDLLAKTSYATFPLQFIPRYGEAAKLAIEGGVLQSALQVCAFALYQLHSEVSANATELRQAQGRYAAIADGADVPGDVVDFNPPEPPTGGGPPHPAPAGPSPDTGEGDAGGGATGGGGPGPAGGGGGGASGGTAMPAALPQPAPQLDLPQSVAPAAPPAPAAPAPTTGMPAPGGAAGAVASVVAPLAGLVTGIALAAGQAAAAGQRMQGDDVEDEDIGEDDAGEEVREGDPEDRVATAGPGQGAGERAPAGASPQETEWGEGVHVGG